MGLREDIQRRIDKKHQEIAEIEAWGRENEMRLREARAYVQGLSDILKLAHREGEQAGGVATLRPGTSLAQAREAIIKQGHPLRLEVLLKAMGKPADRKSRAALGGSLSAYVRRGEVFTRPAPNTFGLVELGHVANATTKNAYPPSTFGQDEQDSPPYPFPPPDDDEPPSGGSDPDLEPEPTVGHRSKVDPDDIPF